MSQSVTPQRIRARQTVIPDISGWARQFCAAPTHWWRTSCRAMWCSEERCCTQVGDFVNSCVSSWSRWRHWIFFICVIILSHSKVLRKLHLVSHFIVRMRNWKFRLFNFWTLPVTWLIAEYKFLSSRSCSLHFKTASCYAAQQNLVADYFIMRSGYMSNSGTSLRTKLLLLHWFFFQLVVKLYNFKIHSS